VFNEPKYSLPESELAWRLCSVTEMQLQETEGSSSSRHKTW